MLSNDSNEWHTRVHSDLVENRFTFSTGALLNVVEQFVLPQGDGAVEQALQAVDGLWVGRRQQQACAGHRALHTFRAHLPLHAAGCVEQRVEFLLFQQNAALFVRADRLHLNLSGDRLLALLQWHYGLGTFLQLCDGITEHIQLLAEILHAARQLLAFVQAEVRLREFAVEYLVASANIRRSCHESKMTLEI